MTFVARCLSRGIALALFGDGVDQNRTCGAFMHSAQNGQQLIEVMTINGPDIGKPQSLEHCAAHSHTFEHVFGTFCAFTKRFG